MRRGSRGRKRRCKRPRGGSRRRGQRGGILPFLPLLLVAGKVAAAKAAAAAAAKAAATGAIGAAAGLGVKRAFGRR